MRYDARKAGQGRLSALSPKLTPKFSALPSPLFRRLYPLVVAAQIATGPGRDLFHRRLGLRQERKDRIDVHGILDHAQRDIDAGFLGALGEARGVAEQHLALARPQE